MSRLFVAVDLPATVRQRLDAEVPRPAEPGVRWLPPAQWHVTLRFLGESDEAEAAAALSTLVATATTARVGPRVSRLNRSVVCLPVHGLDALAAAVLDATGSVGQPPDHPRFTGHLTLGRLRRRGACRVAGTPFSAEVPVDEVVLYRSTLTEEGALHEPLLRVPLSPT